MSTFLYILLAIAAFGVLIAIHEAGHFVAARIFGVTVYEFSLGMGPRLLGWTGKTGTKYSLRLFPIGGFVSMKGEDEDADGEDSLSQKKAWQRFIIVAAGATYGYSLILGKRWNLVPTVGVGVGINRVNGKNEFLVIPTKIGVNIQMVVR